MYVAYTYSRDDILHLVDEVLSKLTYSPIWAKYKESDNYGVALKLFDQEDQGPDSG